MYRKSKKVLSVFLSFILVFSLLLPNIALAQDGTTEEKTVFIKLDNVPEEAEAKFAEFTFSDNLTPLNGNNKIVRHTDQDTARGIVVLQSYNTEKYIFLGWFVNEDLVTEKESFFVEAGDLTISECLQVKEHFDGRELPPCISEVDVFVSSTLEFDKRYTVIPVFEEKQSNDYKLTVNAREGGTATSTILNGNHYQITATPDEDYAFSGWLRNGEIEYFSTKPQTQVEITADTAIVATFEEKYTVEMPEEAKVLETAIQALPLAIKLSDKEKVEEIRAAYDALSPTMKQWIWKDTLVLLTNAEEKIAKLEQQVTAMIEQIAALPAADALVLADESAVNTVKNAFSTLSDEQKALVTNADVLTQLSTKLDVLKGLEATKPIDNKAINNVIDLIKALPKESALKLTDEAKVTTAKKAYDALSKEQQNKVTSYTKLAALVKKLDTLKTAAANQKAADEVIDAIDDLPSVSSLKIKDEDDLEDARKLYKALTKDQKALVTNLEDLEDLEKKMKELKKVNTTATGGGGGGGGSKATAKPKTEMGNTTTLST